VGKVTFKTAITLMAIWLLCQIDMAGVLLKMLWFPVLAAYVFLRVIHNKYFRTPQERAAQLTRAKAVMASMETINSFCRRFPQSNDSDRDQCPWGSLSISPFDQTMGIFRIGPEDN